MSVHPDMTAFRAVDACGGAYSSAEDETGYAEGHYDALKAAGEAVRPVDALMTELLDALVLVLPLAKGYRPEGQTDAARRTCNSWIEAAEAAVAKAVSQ